MPTDKNKPDDEYFQKLEQEKLAALKKKLDAEKAQQSAEGFKALHYLRCGKCGNEMHTKIFKGVEIDICGNCGSVLLDPGELEQLAGDDEKGATSFIASLFRTTKS